MKTTKRRMVAIVGVSWLGMVVAATSLVAQEVPASKAPRTPPPLPPRTAVPVARQGPPSVSVAQAKPAPPAVTPTPLVSPTVPPAPLPPPVTTFPLSNPLTPPVTVASTAQAPDPHAIKWDAELKEYKASAGDTNANFTFWLTNTSTAEILVNRVSTSCGCTVAQLPANPWHIAPGADGPIKVTVNLVGKSGLIAKGVTVDTSIGIKQLTVKVDIPISNPIAGAGVSPAMFSGTMNDGERMKNMQLALSDRQVVFKNQECAKCHADPAKGKTDGRMVYTAVCATCHNSHLRAAMVPDLRALKHPTDASYWRQWIANGRPGSMMPAFAEAEGGPLNEQQITALVEFMVKAFPNRPLQSLAPGLAPATVPVQVQSANSGEKAAIH
jgi:mono/diheme cytochrome c family protein